MLLHPKIKELQRRESAVSYSSMSVDAKGEVAGDNVIKGYLFAWGIRDDYGTTMMKGCCAKSLQERGVDSTSNYKITFLWQHDQKDPIGQFTVLREDDYGLYFEAATDDVPSGNRAVKQVRSKTLNQFSGGFNYVWDKMEYDEKTDSIICKEIMLFEGSVVTIGSNTATYAIRSSAQYPEELDLLKDETEDFIKSLPFKKQYELRQLITRHTALAKFEPQQKALEEMLQAAPQVIDYGYLLNNIK